MNAFQSLRDYETFIYTLPQQFPHITHSTLTVIGRGKRRAEVMGDLFFPMKHHRLPAPQLRFTQPNLPFLILEIERDVL